MTVYINWIKEKHVELQFIKNNQTSNEVRYCGSLRKFQELVD